MNFRNLSSICFVLVAVFVAQAGVAAQISQDDLQTSLTDAARHGDMRSFELARSLGANIHSTDRNGDNCVLAAVEGHQYVLLRSLLRDGVDTDLVGSSGLSPLTAATIHGELRVVRLLLQSGARPDLPSASGSTPVHIAIALGRNEILTELVAAGADLESRDAEGSTPLLVAIHSNNREAFDVLLQHSVQVNEIDKKGRTPLFWAILEDHEDMALALARRGADPKAPLAEYTPLRLAQIMQYKHLLAFLSGN